MAEAQALRPAEPTVSVTPVQALELPGAEAAPPALYRDGRYLGWGSCRHGDIEAAVTVEGGRITSAVITQCLTRYSCSVVDRLPPQVVTRQNAEVDVVSGATESAWAFSDAIFEALSKARYPRVFTRSEVLMGTLVTIDVVRDAAEDAVTRAFEWFHEIEDRCTRFDERSELMQLAASAGSAVPVSVILFEAVRFALQIAEESGGAFDPTIGQRMAARGFNREHRTGREVTASVPPIGDISYRDVRVDPDRRTITLLRPLVLDLGAVAKGLAIDMAALELRPFGDFSIDAGGDLFVGGLNH
jgi:uncharacterized protein with FMN-binding domain